MASSSGRQPKIAAIIECHSQHNKPAARTQLAPTREKERLPVFRRLPAVGRARSDRRCSSSAFSRSGSSTIAVNASRFITSASGPHPAIARPAPRYFRSQRWLQNASLDASWPRRYRRAAIRSTSWRTDRRVLSSKILPKARNNFSAPRLPSSLRAESAAPFRSPQASVG
jgi:hypothetical protein